MIPALCGKCRKSMITPEIDRLEGAAKNLLTIESLDALAHPCVIGDAAALLAMTAGCMRGLCIDCQPTDLHALYANANAGKAVA